MFSITSQKCGSRSFTITAILRRTASYRSPPLLWASYREQIAGAKPDDYLFGSRKGKPIYDRRKLFDKIIAAAGVKVMPKDLRDYFTSICNDPVVAQQMLGHTTLNTTAIYTRQVRERMQKGVENLGANWTHKWGKSRSIGAIASCSAFWKYVIFLVGA